jgi:hypothetical protein
MNEMLANKYLIDGQLPQAIALLEDDLKRPAQSPSTLYTLLICYALEGRCEDAGRIADAIIRRDGGLETERIRGYRHRFTPDLLRRGGRLFGRMCRQSDRRPAVYNRLVLALLLDDDAERTLCEEALHEIHPAVVLK